MIQHTKMRSPWLHRDKPLVHASPSFFPSPPPLDARSLPTLSVMLQQTAHVVPLRHLHVAIPPSAPSYPMDVDVSPVSPSFRSPVLSSMNAKTFVESTSPTCVDDDVQAYEPPSPSLSSSSSSPARPVPVRTSKPRKPSRYLRELDRRVILERLCRGEKQVALAKEYNVSRAAICNLFKHKDEVLARTHEDPLAKHPKKRKPSDGRPRRVRCRLSAGPATPLGANALVQVQSDAVLLQLTKLSDRRTSVDAFRRTFDRLSWLFLEEALSLVPIKFTKFGVSEPVGVAAEHAPCVISLEASGSPLMNVLQTINPHIPVGWIRDGPGLDASPVLYKAQLPATLKYHNVFLMDVVLDDWERLSEAIAAVKRHGALEVMLYVVVLFTSQALVDRVRRAFPHTHFVALQAASTSPAMPSQDSPLAHVDVLLDRFNEVFHTDYQLPEVEA